MKNLCILALTLIFSTGLFANNAATNDSTAIGKILKEIALLNETPDPHCEVPCGIYGDSLRVALISEHIRTIEKGMNQINEISGGNSINYNQIVRWVMNKEKHAEEIQHIVSQYFLHQRIKMTDDSDKKKHARYTKQLSHLHEILVYAMKCKQGTDVDNVLNLKGALENFEHAYFHSH